jgi:GT2 family glycosyltransferase
VLCSTIIPTINRPSLERTLRSALNQDLDTSQHEVIVVNDSGQPLPDAEWLRSKQLTVLNTNRCERSVACNAGAAAARGKYLKFLHDDDWLLPDALKALIEVAERSGSPWVYGAYSRVDDDGRLMSVQRPEVKGNAFAHSVAGDCFPLASSLIQREVFFEVGGFDPLRNTSEDIDLQWRVTRSGALDFTEQMVANIRVGVTGVTSTDWAKMTADCRLVRERALDAPGARRRMAASIGKNVTLRGRCCRACLISALLNLKAGNLATSCRRLLPLVALALPGVLSPAFWRGLGMRSHWHANEKAKEETHLASHYPETFRPQSR